MKDHRYVDELTVDELEVALRLRRRQERLNRLDGGRPPGKDTLEAAVPPSQPSGRVVTASWEAQRSRGEARYSASLEPARLPRDRRPVKWRWVRDQVLLLVEVLAVIGLIWVAARMVLTVREINEESRALQVMPTPAPTPMVRPVVLAGGHTPPDENQQSQPAPIPAHLRDLVTQITPMPVPTRGPAHVQRIIIPVIGVDAGVVLGDDWEALKKGPGWHIGSANPGERGNCVISGHNDIYGEVFRDLPELTVGDEIIVQTHSESYRYAVTQTRVVEETEVSILDMTSSPVLTIYTCYPYRVNTHRFVAIASLVVD
jgi:sortase A